ncbi:MAG TPA: hypothetical protein VF216_01855 [Mizugakiibacter sp.]
MGLLAALYVGSAIAADKVDVVTKGDTKDNFEAVAAAVRKQMAPGGYYQYVQDDERKTVEGRLGDMRTLFDRRSTVDQMTAEEKAQLANDQEAINAILAKRDSRRIICERVRPTGSNIPRRVCRTYGELENERLGVQRTMQDLRNSPQLKVPDQK